MDSVGVREIKMNLSRHLKRVRSDARLVVTERGRSIATITPVEAPVDVDWAHQFVAEGRAHWNGGKPAGATRFFSFDGRLNRAARRVTRTLERTDRT